MGSVWFGTALGFDTADSPNMVLRVLDLATGRVSVVPGSKGLFSPRWSPDGRHIVAFTSDSLSLRMYDIAAQAWSDLAPGEFGPWFGALPDGTPLTLVDAGTHDIYALEWEAP
jgi:hypothetical protein